ncbi:MAG TPA: hypothetical protein VFS05_15175 [Gemmatimonadaceae bacterium]|nr:hypothetical protein [Gemmatimonadaceae bacterium]
MTTMMTPELERSTNDLGLPPPRVFELTDADRSIGWIVGNVVGFRGFASDVEAAHAAWVAYRTLARRLARGRGERLVPIDTEPLSIHRRAEGEVILASGREIATLVRPGEGSRSGPDSFGFEIPVPSPADELTVRAKAQLIYRTLRKSGIRWALWQPGAGRLTMAAPAATDGTAGHPPASDGARADTRTGGESDALRHHERRPWWLPALPWRQAGRMGHWPGRGPAGVRERG